MKSSMKLYAASAALLILLSSEAQGYAQGTLRPITFDGPPFIPPGDDIGVTYYYEDSMSFTPIDPGDLFGRAGGGRAGFPDNGTAYILQGFGDSLAGYRTDFPTPRPFGLYSVDVA